MIKTKNLQKIFRTEEVKKQRQFRYCILLIFLIAAACGNSRRPGLSDKDLFAQRKVDTLQESEQVPDFSDMETYVIPSGIKYKESRTVDPAQPPVVLDIANRKLNFRKFNLSDYYTKVQYVKLKYPRPATEGNFLLDKIGLYSIPVNEKLQRLISVTCQFKFTDDYIIAGELSSGIYCYDREGKFLFTIESNDIPITHSHIASRGDFTRYDATALKGFYGNITVNGNNCLYNLVENYENMICFYDLTQERRIMTRPFDGKIQGGTALILDHQSMADYVYEPVRKPKDFLFTFDLKGDTLCWFPNYNPPMPKVGGGSYSSPLPPDIYYHGGRLTIRQAFNDTVYRVVSPNRMIPAYVLNFGAYGADVPTFYRENLSEKLLPDTWKETDQYILFVYTQGTKSRDGNNQFFYSYYDKKSRQFYHFSERTSIPPEQFFMENPIPDALPFVWSYAETEDHQLRVFYTKKRLEEISKSKEFASLSPEQQNKLKTMQNELDDSEVLIMILE